MRSKLAICIGVWALAGTAQAATDEVRQGPAPVWATLSDPLPVPADVQGLAFVRRNDTFVHLDQGGQSSYQGYWIRLLHENALQLGNLSIAWNPSAGAPTVHTLRIHRNGAVIDVLKTAKFEILRREHELEASKLDGELTAILRVPYLRVGDELEAAWSLPMTDPTLGEKAAGMLGLQNESPPGRYQLGLSWADGFEPKVKFTSDLSSQVRRGNRALRILLDNSEALETAANAPDRFNWQRTIEFSRYPDWPSASRLFAPLFQSAAKLGPQSPLKAEAAKIAAQHRDPLARAAAALTLTQRDIRYIYVGLDGGNYRPASADETWQRRYGDCKGKTAVLLSLLAELGIEARPVLVLNSGGDDGMNERLPSPTWFDHVLVQAQIGGKTYWMDGTLPPVAPPAERPVLAYRWGLPLTATGSELQRVAWRPADRPDTISLARIDARAGFAKPAEITKTSITRGINGLAQQMTFSAMTPAQILAAARKAFADGTMDEVSDAKWRYDVPAQASVLTIVGKAMVEWEDEGEGNRSLALPGGGFSPPERKVRSDKEGASIPFAVDSDFSCAVTTLVLPADTKPAQWSFNSTYDTQLYGRTYYRAFELRDGAIRMIRASRPTLRELAAAAAKRDTEKLVNFDNSMAMVSFDPKGQNSAFRPGGPVPTTEEADWLRDTSACGPPNKAS